MSPKLLAIVLAFPYSAAIVIALVRGTSWSVVLAPVICFAFMIVDDVLHVVLIAHFKRNPPETSLHLPEWMARPEVVREKMASMTQSLPRWRLLSQFVWVVAAVGCIVGAIFASPVAGG